MINGLTQDIASRAVERGVRPTRADREGDKSFADQLLGGSAKELEGPNRSERSSVAKKATREDKPGRELLRPDSKSDGEGREGKRSVERDSTKEESGIQRAPIDARRKTKRLDPKQEPAEDPNRSAQEVRATSTQGRPLEPKVEQRESSESSSRGEDFFALENRRGLGVSDKAEARVINPMLQQNAVKPLSVTDTETVNIITAMQNEQVAVRQQAMQKFVVQMQDELGVPPEKLLEAFANLDAEQLMAPPEEAMSSFMDGLSLTPVQEERAADLYQEMVRTTGEASLNEKFLSMEAGTNFEVLSPRDRALRDLNQSLSQLNDTFFMNSSASPMKAQMAAENMDAQLVRLAQAKSNPQEAQEQNSKGLAFSALMMGSAGGAAGLMQAGASEGIPSGSGHAQMAGLDAGAEGDMNLLGLDSGDSVININSLSLGDGQNGSSDSDFANEFLGQDASSLDAGREKMARMNNSPNQTDFAAQMAAERSKAGGEAARSGPSEGEAAKGSSTSMGLDSTLSAAVPAAGQTQPLMAGAASAGPAAMIINGPQPTAQDEAENVRELIKQAQVMLKKGGGEMKLEMRPEGMGQVHLKVNVENGQVHVQMLTENDATKKLIESGLNDLRSHLTAQKLQVESLSVDLGREIQKQMEHNQQEANREQARQFAQDFMGSFREDRQGFRQGVAESSGLRSYGRAQNRPSIEPDSVSSLRSASAHRAGESRRLNVVA